MHQRTLLISGGLLFVLVALSETSLPLNQRATAAKGESAIDKHPTPEEARSALVKLVRTRPEPKYLFGSIDPDQLARAKIQSEKQVCWIGGFRIDLKAKSYSILYDPKSGRKSDARVYGETFIFRKGEWTAPPPKFLFTLPCLSDEGKDKK